MKPLKYSGVFLELARHLAKEVPESRSFFFREQIKALAEFAEHPERMGMVKAYPSWLRRFAAAFNVNPDLALRIMQEVRLFRAEADLSAEAKVRRFLRKNPTPVNKQGTRLTLKEIADRLRVTEDTVKQTRTKLRTEDEEVNFITEEPCFFAYMKSGERTPELEAFMVKRERRKVKKTAE